MSARTFVPRGLSIVAVPLALSLALAACSSGGGAAAGGGQPTDGASAAGSAAGPVTGHVGDKLTFAKLGGDPVDATLVKVFDPATPNDASEAPLASGSHWVGVELIVDNHVDYQDEGSAFDAITSTGSPAPNTSEGAVLGDGFVGCTQTAGSEQDAEIYTHCLTFVVPDGETLAKVGALIGGAEIGGSLVPADQATWTVP